MSSPSPETDCPAEFGSICARRHWSVYWLIIVLALSTVVGNILQVRNTATRGESPFFSANDRSRWCTIYSLVHFGTYEIDQVVTRESPIHWDTIDKVQHVGTDGEMHQYSSKPALLPTLLAGEYWLIRQVSGLNLDDNPILVARIMLIISNAIPFMLMLTLLAAMLERMIVSDWVRYFILSAAGFGTFLSTFCVTVNNHLPAAVAVTSTLYCVDAVLRNVGNKSRALFFLAGLSAGFATVNELPALSMAVAVFFLLSFRSILRTLIFYLAGFAAISAAFFLTNVAAHGLWEIPYSHRNDGPVIAKVNGDFSGKLDQGILPKELSEPCQQWVVAHSAPALERPVVSPGSWMGQSTEILGRWVIRDSISTTQFAVVELQQDEFEIREWGNWYDFPGSYWSSDVNRRSPVDRGEPSQISYAFHMLIGHHGIFSLTPIWAMSLAGMITLMIDWRFKTRWLGLMSLVLTVVVFAFYLTREMHDRNFGGQTSALRWMFWLIPFWLLSLAPIVHWLGRTTLGRWFCFALLLASVLSAAYSIRNPWVHPWLYEVWQWFGV